MRRWTTPTQKFILHGVELTNCDVYLTIQQNKSVETFKNPLITVENGDTILEFDFTQLDTSKFNVGGANVQVNWVTPSNKRWATDIAKIRITKNLLQQEVTYDG